MNASRTIEGWLSARTWSIAFSCLVVTSCGKATEATPPLHGEEPNEQLGPIAIIEQPSHLDPARVTLGAQLFNDTRMSGNGKLAAPLDLNEAIENTLTIARNEYRFVADLSTDFGVVPEVVCNAAGIRQVLLNLIVNAAHAIGDVVGPPGKGSGQGLAISQSIVDQHGGKLWFETTINQGTTFFVQLPIEARERRAVPSSTKAA